MTDLDDRRTKLDDLFVLFDLDGNGVVGLQELTQVIQATNRVGDKKHKKWVSALEAQIHQARQTNRRSGTNSSQVHLKSGGTINFFGDANGEPSLDPAAFRDFITSLTSKDTEAEFEEFCELVKNSVAEAREKIEGSDMKTIAWQCFQYLDENHDGHVDFTEISTLFLAENKNNKKALFRWAAILSQRQSEHEAPAAKAASPNTDLTSPTDCGDSILEEHTTLQLTLSDFHRFMQEYTNNDVDRAREICEKVKEYQFERNRAYTSKMRLGEVFDCLMEDLLRERPDDVLEGIIKSAQRLQRTQKFPKQLYAARRRSSVARNDNDE